MYIYILIVIYSSHMHDNCLQISTFESVSIVTKDFTFLIILNRLLFISQ